MSSNSLILVLVDPSERLDYVIEENSILGRLRTYYIYRYIYPDSTRAMPEDEFELKRRNNEYLQVREYRGYKYGLSKASVRRVLDKGLTPIVSLVSSSLHTFIDEFGKDNVFVVFIDKPMMMLLSDIKFHSGEDISDAEVHERLRDCLVEKDYYHSHKDEFDVYFINVFSNAREAVDNLFQAFSAPEHLNRWMSTLK